MRVVFYLFPKRHHMKNYKYMTCTVGVMLQQLSNSSSRCRKGRGRQNLHPGDIWRRNREIFFFNFNKPIHMSLVYSWSINNKADHCILRWKKLPQFSWLGINKSLLMSICLQLSTYKTLAMFYVPAFTFPAIFLHFPPIFCIFSPAIPFELWNCRRRRGRLRCGAHTAKNFKI